jgi:hypothetical protein
VASLWFDDSKTRGAADRCRLSPQEILNTSKNLRPVTEGTIFIRSGDGVADPPWAGVAVLHSTRTVVSASRENRLRRSTPLHYSTHQAFDQLLADQAILMAGRHCRTDVQRFQDAIA